MSILPIMKKCSRCGKKYSWNPDVGKLRCPKCGAMAGSAIEVGFPPDETVSIGDIPLNNKRKKGY